MLVILIALRWVEKTGKDKALICSDSASSAWSFYGYVISHLISFYVISHLEHPDVLKGTVLKWF